MVKEILIETLAHCYLVLYQLNKKELPDIGAGWWPNVDIWNSWKLSKMYQVCHL